MQALNEGRPAAITAGRQTDTAASANESAWPISTSSVWLSIGRRVLAGRSPDDATLCVIDNVLQYQVLIYTPEGRCLHTYRPYEHTLGVKSFGWSPTGQFLALKCFGGCVLS